MSNKAMVVWFPILDCNLLCSYCISRSLPIVTHGKLRTAKEWSKVWDECPWEVDNLNICGGEPSLFPDFKNSLAGGGKFPFIHLNSNLIKHPKYWWHDDLCHVKSLSVGWHHHMNHPNTRRLWEHIKWVIEYRISDPYMVCITQPLEPQRTTSEETLEMEERCKELGIKYWPVDYDDIWQWRDWMPVREGRAISCTGGYDMMCVLPDGSGYRCLCKPYAGMKPFTNLIEDGWSKVLKQPEPCDELVCSNYPICDRVETVYEGGTIPTMKSKKPGIEYDYVNNYRF